MGLKKAAGQVKRPAQRLVDGKNLSRKWNFGLADVTHQHGSGMAMRSLRLASILDGYVRLGGLAEMSAEDDGIAVVARADRFSVMVSITPDQEKIMLFAEIGTIANVALRGDGNWIAIDGDANDDGDGDGDGDGDSDDDWDFDDDDLIVRSPVLLYDERSGTVALADVVSASAADCVAFSRWLQCFENELTHLSSMLDEVEAARGAANGEQGARMPALWDCA